MFGYNWIALLENQSIYSVCEEQYCVRIYGNVQNEVFIGVSQIQASAYTGVENAPFFMLNRFNTTWTVVYSGVPVWDLIQLSGELPENASFIVFEAEDGFRSFNLPIRLVQLHPEKVILATHENGVLIPEKILGGDGPIKAAVDYDLVADDAEAQAIFLEMGSEFVYNSVFNVKYVNAIRVV